MFSTDSAPRNSKDSLYSKRDNLRVKIRKQNISEIMKDRRKMLLCSNSSEQAILINIDCVAAIHNVRSQYNPLPITKSIEEILFYSRSSRAEHIFSFFNEELVEHLVNLLHKSISDRTDKCMELITKHILWILTNYTSCKECIISHDFVILLISLLKTEDFLLNDLTLTSLGNLCENRCYKDLILNSNILKTIAQNGKRFPPNCLSFFLMKILEDLDYSLFSENLDEIIKTLTYILYESDNYETSMNVIQGLLAVFTTSNIEKNIRLVLSNSREVKALFQWILKDLPENFTNSRIIPKTIELFNAFYLAECDDEADQEELEKFIWKNVFSLTIQIIQRFKDSKCQNTRAAIYEIIQNICSNGEFAFEVLANHRWLIDNIISCCSTDIYKIKVLCIGAACNLCRSCQENEIVYLASKKVIPLLAHKLNEYEDARLNLSIIKALQEIFNIGDLEKQQRELFYNQFFLEFKNADGVKNLTKLQQGLNQQVSEYATRILDKYRSQYENTDHDRN